MGLSREAYTDIVKAFLSTVRDANYYPILYTGKYTLGGVLDKAKLEGFDLWLAQYTSEGHQAKLGQTMWQFTVAGHPTLDYAGQKAVSGVKGKCDCDWSYVGYAAKIKKLGMNQPLVTLRAEKLVARSELASEKAFLVKNGYNVL